MPKTRTSSARTVAAAKKSGRGKQAAKKSGRGKQAAKKAGRPSKDPAAPPGPVEVRPTADVAPAIPGESLPWPVHDTVDVECGDIRDVSGSEEVDCVPGMGASAISNFDGSWQSNLPQRAPAAPQFGHATAPPPPPLANSPMACLCDDLGANVDMSIKEKIWRGEFIELGLLVKKEAAQLDEPATFCLSPSGAGLTLKPQTRTPAISNIEQWTSAFLIFASIYLERHTTRARELLKYMEIIRSITRFGGYNWRAYDMQFRLRQARQPQRTWSVIDTELWLTVATSGAAPSAQYFRRQDSAARRFPATSGYGYTAPTGRRGDAPRNAGHCFAFNRGACSRAFCRYVHTCSICGNAAHGSFACGAKRGSAKSGGSAPKQNRALNSGTNTN